jgi:hypothetical protein
MRMPIARVFFGEAGHAGPKWLARAGLAGTVRQTCDETIVRRAAGEKTRSRAGGTVHACEIVQRLFAGFAFY